MNRKAIIELCRKIALSMNVDPDLAVAIAGQESNYDPSAVRYEALWDYPFQVDTHASRLGITSLTEFQLQKMSWGAMQVMGTVARELGFKPSLVEMIIPQNGIFYGCKKLQLLSKKYTNQFDVIASYNAGIPSKIDGEYKNASYVDAVRKRIAMLKTLQ